MAGYDDLNTTDYLLVSVIASDVQNMKVPTRTMIDGRFVRKIWFQALILSLEVKV